MVIWTPQVVVLPSKMIRQFVLSCKACSVCLTGLDGTFVVTRHPMSGREMTIKVVYFAKGFSICALGVVVDVMI
jgi:hypothetical protein